jgi:hypothetical protein
VGSNPVIWVYIYTVIFCIVFSFLCMNRTLRGRHLSEVSYQISEGFTVPKLNRSSNRPKGPNVTEEANRTVWNSPCLSVFRRTSRKAPGSNLGRRTSDPDWISVVLFRLPRKVLRLDLLNIRHDHFLQHLFQLIILDYRNIRCYTKHTVRKRR